MQLKPTRLLVLLLLLCGVLPFAVWVALGAQQQIARPDGTVATSGTDYMAAGGGSDPWTYVKLAADTTYGGSVDRDIKTLNFTPAASTTYEIEGLLLLRTATTTVNPQAGLGWPNGVNDGIAVIQQSQAATGTPLFASGNPTAFLLVAVGGLPNTTSSWPATVKAMFGMSAVPSGTFHLRIASETAGTNVTVKKASFFRYRTVP